MGSLWEPASSLGDIYVRNYYTATINSGTSGTVTPGAGITIIADSSANGEGCLVGQTAADGSFEPAFTANGIYVRATITAGGVWAFTDGAGNTVAPASYPVTLVYEGKIEFKNFIATGAFTEILDFVAGARNREKYLVHGDITDTIILTSAQLNSVLVSNCAGTTTVSLPNITASLVGSWMELVKLGTGYFIINPYAGGSIYATVGTGSAKANHAKKASIMLIAISTTQWWSVPTGQWLYE